MEKTTVGYKAEKTIPFLLLVLCIFLAPQALVFISDRYILFVIPLLLLPLLIFFNTQNITVSKNAVLAIGLMIAFTIVASRDYFALNRTRWGLLNGLMDQGVNPTQIDGGLEFNGFYTYRHVGCQFDYKGSWWWVVNNEYVVTTQRELEGYTERDSLVYQRLMPGGINTIFLHQGAER